MVEEWKEIPGFEGLYEVSNQGRVRSIYTNYDGKLARRKEPKVLKPIVRPDNYLVVNLSDRKCNTKHYRIARLVLITFIGYHKKNLDASHLNGDRKDNRLINLSWMTRLENNRLKQKHGYPGIYA